MLLFQSRSDLLNVMLLIIRMLLYKLKRRWFLIAVTSVIILVTWVKFRDYNVTSQCHNTSLRPDPHQREDVTCQMHKPHPDTCRYANKYFGNPTDDLGTRKCFYSSTSDICWFTDTLPSKLVCSLDFCGDSTIYMARMDTTYGCIRNWEAIPSFTTEKAMIFVQQSIDQGETFCLIKCASLIRAIIFPPKLLFKTKIVRENNINVAIVVLDSLSRRHFYRMLRKSASVLRKIANEESTPATVLDFEFFQSINSHTFDSLRPLFSGVTNGDKNFNENSAAVQKSLGIDVLFKHYKSEGYQTVFQEDACWYDEWGMMLNNLESKPDSKPSAERWTRFKRIIKQHHVDHVGITHFSCEVLKTYGITNHYETPSKVCFNGRFFNSYFYRYIRTMFKAVRNRADAAPILLYQHFNTAHTETGTRIQNMDEELAEFINFMARNPNTWTLILSDHGHSRTRYARTWEGLLERYNPLLFMIIPKNVNEYLGKEIMDNLERNQRRLLTTLDIHKALMTFHHESNNRSKDFRTFGIFSKIPLDRACMDLPLMPLTRCICDGSEYKFKDNSPSHTWLAEFALGSLNGFIHKQFSTGRKSTSLGYGRCIRMTGKSFRNVIQNKWDSQVTFDLHVDASSVGLHEDEVFRVAVQLGGELKLASYERHTMYNKFKVCADESVDLKLCVCDKRKTPDEIHTGIGSKEIRKMGGIPMFGSSVNVTDLYGGCLLQVTRSHPSGISIAYEVLNSCSDKTFQVEVRGSSYYVFLSRQLPMVFEVKPNTVQFMFSSAKAVIKHSYLGINVKVTNIKQS